MNDAITAGPTCPNDGAVLNRHAVLFSHPTGDEMPSPVSPVDGVLTDVFTCPRCGYTDGRPHGSSMPQEHA
jgi:hypothetical protein